MPEQTATVDEQTWEAEWAATQAEHEARIAALIHGKSTTVAIDELTLRTIGEVLQGAHSETVDLLLDCRTAEQAESVEQRIAALVSALRWCDTAAAAFPSPADGN